MLGLRGTRHILARLALRNRYNSSQATPRPMPKTGEAGEEFGPSWQYVGSRVVSYLVIPSVGAYAVFFWDFGEREHVFQPARRWAADTINGFFSLSSDEKQVQWEDHADQPASEDSTSA